MASREVTCSGPSFLSREWALWAWGGMAIIVGGTWYQVQVDVQINEWFGDFYDAVQVALGTPGSMSIEEFYALLITFARIAGIYIVVAVMLSFFTKHWVFRWRHAMNDFYMARWERLRHIEGASQRIQEDTRRFAIIMESLGSRLLDSVMTLIAFLPILWQLSKSIKVVPIIGELDHCAGLRRHHLRALRHRRARRRRHQAAGTGVQQPGGRGRLPQGTGLWRGP